MLIELCIDAAGQYTTADPSQPLPASQGLPLLLEKAPLCQTVGLGIVTWIDPGARMFYVLTPLPPELMASVNLVVRGQLDLPPIMLRRAAASAFDAGDRAPYYVGV